MSRRAPRRAPALGRKARAGPITHLAEPWPPLYFGDLAPGGRRDGMHGPYCRCGTIPMEFPLTYGTPLAPLQTIPFGDHGEEERQ